MVLREHLARLPILDDVGPRVHSRERGKCGCRESKSRGENHETAHHGS
jgi:hypothetical protein